MSDASVAQLVRTVNRQWKDPGWNPGTVKCLENVWGNEVLFAFLNPFSAGRTFRQCLRADISASGTKRVNFLNTLVL